MSIINKLERDIKTFNMFHMNDEDSAYTLEKLRYRTITKLPDTFYCDTQVFNDYVQSLIAIVEKKQGKLEVFSLAEGKQILCTYGDLKILCNIKFMTKEWTFYIERQNDTEHFYYYLGEQYTPFLFLMLLLKPECFDNNNFRYSLNKTNEDGIRLYCKKKDAILHFKEMISQYSASISKIDFSAKDTSGTIYDSVGNVLGTLKNLYETDDIKLDFRISNMCLVYRIYNLLREDHSNMEIEDILKSIGLDMENTHEIYDMQVFSKIYKYDNFKEQNITENTLVIKNERNFTIQITNVGHDGYETFYEVFIEMISDSGRRNRIDTINFNESIGFPATPSGRYTFTQVCALIHKMSEMGHSSFPFTLLTNIGGQVVNHRFISFDLALNSNFGFYRLSLDNDVILLDIQNKTGKSYKVDANNKKYDYVVIDKKDNVAAIYSELLRDSLPENMEILRNKIR